MAYSYKGAITFGLVYIPITLSVSIKENDIGFNMLDKKTMSRVKYKKTCVDCDDREVNNKDIVKGYQYEKDKYVLFTEEDFEKIKSPKDKNITITEFVNLNEVDPVLFDKAYYVTPTGGEKAFGVLLKAMEKKNKAGIAKTVLGTKETLILLRASNGKMLVNTLYFYNEVQTLPAIKIPKIEKKELDLATALIDEMSETFKPEKYKDEYNEKLKKAIQKKISGKNIVATKEKQRSTKVIDLMKALQMSLKGNGNVTTISKEKRVK